MEKKLPENLTGNSGILNLLFQASSVAKLVLDVDLSPLHLTVEVPHHVLVFHQGGVGEDLVHNHLLVVGIGS